MHDSFRMLRDHEVPLTPLLDKTVAVLGFGNQGHAHSLNLRDSGVKVIVANRSGSLNGKRAIEMGFELMCGPDAVKQADLVIMALPDEVQPEVFERHLKPNLRAGMAIGFIHGFNIHFKTIVPPNDVDVILVSPKGPGTLVRSNYEKRLGVPCLLGVAQDATGHAREIALAWANGIGGARAGVIETTFKNECETDLFGEQAVLCGGLSALVKAGFETLVEAGYPPELAYFECVHEVKQIVDLIYVGGLDFMRQSISNTAEYGDMTRGPRLINESTKVEMRKILSEIQSGQFAREFRAEYESGMKLFNELFEKDRSHLMETIGKTLRKSMPWLDAKAPTKK